MGTDGEQRYSRDNPPPWDRSGFQRRAFELWRARLGDLDHGYAIEVQCRNCLHRGVLVPWVLLTRHRCRLEDVILRLVRWRCRCSKCGAKANKETFVHRVKHDRIAGWVIDS